jgi:hypothetical protein
MQRLVAAGRSTCVMIGHWSELKCSPNILLCLRNALFSCLADLRFEVACRPDLDDMYFGLFGTVTVDRTVEAIHGGRFSLLLSSL